MPAAEPILDFASLANRDPTATPDEIGAWIPQRHEMQMLHGILYYDEDLGVSAGYRDIREDEFWVRGHIPARPLFPGVLMIETAAQLCGFTFCRIQQDDRFFGFSGVDDVRFRGTVEPGDRFVVMAKKRKLRRNLGMFDTQGFVDGKQVYSGIITGMIVPT